RRHPARRGEGDRLRGEIVAAALRLLGESGDLNALSLRAVAREVGVAATSIYLHFPDLEALLREVKMELFDELLADHERAAAEAGSDPASRLRARARAYLRFAAERPGHYRVLFQSRVLKQSDLPQGATHLGSEAFDALQSEVAALVGDDSSFMVTLHLWTAMHGMVVLRTDRPNFPWPDLEHELDDLVARLIGTAPPR
ncbi:MAG: TetR/AcrR family transcriptional regulator, partial [Streptosporangiales bacterium]